jgi:glycosyltransferase involved in cell wall biosynthesis
MGLRILLVSDHYPPFIGGAHRQTQLLAHELHQRGHEVNVVTVWSGGLPEEEDDAGVPVFRLKQLRTWLPVVIRDRNQRHQPPFPDPITVIGLRQLVRRLKPDVVHASGWFSFSCVLALMGTHIPLLVSARDYGYSCARRTLVYRGEQICDGPVLQKCLGCAADLYGAPKGWLAALGVLLGRSLLRHKVRGAHSISAYVQEIMRRDFWGEQPRDQRINKHSIVETIIPSFREDDTDQYSSADPQNQGYLDRLPTEKFILYVGALRRVKGINQLLAAYEKLVSPPPLVLIGTFEFDSPRDFPSGVIVLDSVPHSTVMAAWERSLFGVIPSLWPEPLGSVVYEGMSCGKAVIGTTPGGHTDMIIPGETGLLVPSGDIEALTLAMATLINQPELRERLGKAARKRSMLFTANVAVPQFERFYRRVIGQSTDHNQREIDIDVLGHA